MLAATSAHPAQLTVPTTPPAVNQNAVNQPGSEHPFFIACRNGKEEDVNYIRAQLEDNPDLAKAKYKSGIAKTDEEFDPLIPAAQGGNIEVIDLLCEYGADPNAPRLSNGNTPLHYAAQKGHHEAIKTLIALGATMDMENHREHTPLTQTIASIILMSLPDKPLSDGMLESRYRVIEHFLKSGAEIRKTVPPFTDDTFKQRLNDYNLLHRVIQMDDNYPKTFSMFISQGADLNHKDHEGNTPLHCAASAGKSQLLNEIINNDAYQTGDGDIDAKNSEGMTPLMLAAEAGDTQAMQTLVKHGADPAKALKDAIGKSKFKKALAALISKNGPCRPLINRPDENGNTPLVKSISKSLYQTANLLLENGAELPKNVPATVSYSGNTFKSKSWEDLFSKHMTNGQTPFTLAACLNADKVITMFMQLGADPNQKDKLGTALHYAAYRGYNNVINAITEHNPDGGGASPDAVNIEIDAKDANGITALQLAIEQGQAKTAKLLLGKGADSTGMLKLAIEQGQTEVVKMLLEKGDDPTELLFTAVKKDDMELLKKLPPLLTPEQMEKLDHTGNSALALALSKGKLDATEELLKAGARKTLTPCPIKDKDWTKLISQPSAGRHKGTTMLRADPGVGNNNGALPLDIAAKYGNAKIIEMLMNHPNSANKVDIYRPAQRGKPAVMLANEGQHTEALKALIKNPDQKNASAPRETTV